MEQERNQSWAIIHPFMTPSAFTWLTWGRNSFRGIKRTNVIQWGWATATVRQIAACCLEMSNCNCSGVWWSRLSRRHGHHGALLYGHWAQLLPSPSFKWQNWTWSITHKLVQINSKQKWGFTLIINSIHPSSFVTCLEWPDISKSPLLQD